MSKRDEAAQLLQHYVALCMGKRSARELEPDYRVELEQFVDCIIAAARESLEERGE
jgi:hypothetical protein